MPNRKLGKYFTESEFTYSQVGTSLKIDNSFQTPQQVVNATKLCSQILDVIREYYGKSVDISSGFRCPLLNSNKKIGGATNSYHLTGNAADINVSGHLPKDVFNDIMEGKIKLPNGKPLRSIIDECIYEEKHLKTGIVRWVHIQRSDNPRGKFMYSPDGKTYQTVTHRI